VNTTLWLWESSQEVAPASDVGGGLVGEKFRVRFRTGQDLQLYQPHIFNIITFFVGFATASRREHLRGYLTIFIPNQVTEGSETILNVTCKGPGLRRALTSFCK
jgi:hypothetical protein